MIELENVSYTYGGGELLSDVSVQLQPGSFHFLTGPSGAGKTTLLKLCYGALLPSSGRLSVFDQIFQRLIATSWPYCVAALVSCIRIVSSLTT